MHEDKSKELLNNVRTAPSESITTSVVICDDWDGSDEWVAKYCMHDASLHLHISGIESCTLLRLI